MLTDYVSYNNLQNDTFNIKRGLSCNFNLLINKIEHNNKIVLSAKNKELIYLQECLCDETTRLNYNMIKTKLNNIAVQHTNIVKNDDIKKYLSFSCNIIFLILYDKSINIDLIDKYIYDMSINIQQKDNLNKTLNIIKIKIDYTYKQIDTIQSKIINNTYLILF